MLAKYAMSCAASGLSVRVNDLISGGRNFRVNCQFIE